MIDVRAREELAITTPTIHVNRVLSFEVIQEIKTKNLIILNYKMAHFKMSMRNSMNLHQLLAQEPSKSKIMLDYDSYISETYRIKQIFILYHQNH